MQICINVKSYDSKITSFSWSCKIFYIFQHDPGDGDADGHQALFKRCGDEAAKGQRRHHAQREGEERVGAGEHRVHLLLCRRRLLRPSPQTGAGVSLQKIIHKTVKTTIKSIIKY